MRELQKLGLISNYDDYLNLPFSVLEDARLLLEAESAAHERAAREREQQQRALSRGKRR